MSNIENCVLEKLNYDTIGNLIPFETPITTQIGEYGTIIINLKPSNPSEIKVFPNAKNGLYNSNIQEYTYVDGNPLVGQFTYDANTSSLVFNQSERGNHITSYINAIGKTFMADVNIATKYDSGNQVIETLDEKLVEVDKNIIKMSVCMDELVYNLSDYGVTNSTSSSDCKSTQIQNIADICRQQKGTLFLPSNMDVYINKPLDLTGIDIEFRGTVRTKSLNPIILFKVGSADPKSSVVQNIYINRVITESHNDRIINEEDVSVRLVGSKNSKVEIGWVNCFEIYADGSSALEHSTSYGNFTIRCCDYLRIFGENTITPIPSDAINNGSEGFGWVTECTFHKCRVRKKLYIGGNYNHNNNVFNHLTLENATLEIQNGNRNIFKNVRTEGDTKIIFGEKSWHNVFYDLFQSNQSRRIPNISIDDSGFENIVTTNIMENLDEMVALDLISNKTINKNWCDYDIQNISILTITESISVSRTWMPIVDTIMDTTEIKRFKVYADTPNWRYWIQCYDKNGDVLNDEKNYNLQAPRYIYSEAFPQSSNWWDSNNKEYRNTVNAGTFEFGVSNKVDKIRLRIVTGDKLFSFNNLSLTVFANKNSKIKTQEYVLSMKKYINRINLIDDSELLNEYKNFDNSVDAQYRGLNYTYISKDTIYLSGYLNKSSIRNGEIVFTLPIESRPKYRIFGSMAIYTSDKGMVSGFYEIDVNGNIIMLSTCSNVTRISLIPSTYKIKEYVYQF